MAKHHTIKSLLTGLWLVATLSGGTAAAQLQAFHASWEQSSWQVETGSQQCALVHDIPRFGRARFEQRSGHRLQFSIAVEQPPVSDMLAQLHSEAPPWQHQVARRDLGQFRLRQGKTPLVIPREQALRLYYELEQGMKPVFEFADWSDGSDQVQVALIPVRFREALAEFQQCTAKLLYLDFEPLGEETVFFSTNSDRLSLAARRTLEALALNYRKQPNIRLVLGGHADERGHTGYNLDLSRRRAALALPAFQGCARYGD